PRSDPHDADRRVHAQRLRRPSGPELHDLRRGPGAGSDGDAGWSRLQHRQAAGTSARRAWPRDEGSGRICRRGSAAGGPVMSLLDVDGASKRFGGVQEVDDVSLHLDQGEILGIIGPNGAGKTSLFNLITGTIRTDSGRISLGGTDI